MRDDTEAHLTRLKELFDVRQNPKFAWQAYSLARDTRLPIPDWVLRYFDLVADNLLFLHSAKAGEIQAGVTAALGFTAGGAEGYLVRRLSPDSNVALRLAEGALNLVKNLTTEERDRVLFGAVEFFERNGHARSDAKRRAAEAHGVNVRTVERALRVFKDET